MSGSQIQPFVCRGVRFSANAATRLTAKNSVPTKSTAALSQPIRSGSYLHQRQRLELSDPWSSMSVGVLTACRTEA